MARVAVSALKQAVEIQHDCRAVHVHSVPIKRIRGGKMVWKGVVHVFRIRGHPVAKQAYAWAMPMGGIDTRRLFTVLHLPPIASPQEAVGAGIAEHENANMGGSERE
jgi:hypothetical protein